MSRMFAQEWGKFQLCLYGFGGYPKRLSGARGSTAFIYWPDMVAISRDPSPVFQAVNGDDK